MRTVFVTQSVHFFKKDGRVGYLDLPPGSSVWWLVAVGEPWGSPFPTL